MHKHLKIEYPCEWEYRIIGTSEELMRKAVIEIIGSKEYELLFSNKSKAGKYVSLILKTVVVSEEERKNIYLSLRKSAAIRSVI
jgi:putative lipoic acid-binding regulatory protein